MQACKLLTARNLARQNLFKMGQMRCFSSVASDLQSALESGQEGHIDEHFRKSFRKVSCEQAVTLLKSINQAGASHDGSFWVWETLEEAVKGHAEALSKEDFEQVCHAFFKNYKGSDDLHDELDKRIYLDNIELK